MALKKCPRCGKKIALNSVYCIYCATRFDETEGMADSPALQETFDSEAVELPLEEEQVTKKRVWLLPLVISLSLLLAVVVSALFWLPPLLNSAPQEPVETTTTKTVTTRDPNRDVWLQTFTGRWVDEASVGKKDIAKQGGAMLFVHEIRRDLVVFDLLSYSGGEFSHLASVSNVVAVLDQNTLHFEFKNDTQGHSGEGYLRFRDDEVDLEVLIDGEESLAEGEHSLAMNTVFKRLDLPQSTGTDLRLLTSIAKIKEVAGEPTQEPVTDAAAKTTTYVFGALTAVAREDGTVITITLNYNALENKSQYCYECVDGTMNYDGIKSYFGEAIHDYVEQPTDIRVLYYEFSNSEKVRFTFDAKDNLLIKIHCA